MQKNLPKYAKVHEFEFRRSLPRTMVGKVDFRKLQEENMKKRLEDIVMKNKQFKGEFGYKLLTPIMRVFFRIYYNPKIINKEAIPKDGPILIVGNHKHIYDQMFGSYGN